MKADPISLIQQINPITQVDPSAKINIHDIRQKVAEAKSKGLIREPDGNRMASLRLKLHKQEDQHRALKQQIKQFVLTEGNVIQELQKKSQTEAMEKSYNQMGLSMDLSALSAQDKTDICNSILRQTIGQLEESKNLSKQLEHADKIDVRSLRLGKIDDDTRYHDITLLLQNYKLRESNTELTTEQQSSNLLTKSQMLNERIERMDKQYNLKQLYQMQQDIKKQQIQLLKQRDTRCYDTIKRQTQKVVHKIAQMENDQLDDIIRKNDSEALLYQSGSDINDFRRQLQTEYELVNMEYQNLYHHNYNVINSIVQSKHSMIPKLKELQQMESIQLLMLPTLIKALVLNENENKIVDECVIHLSLDNEITLQIQTNSVHSHPFSINILKANIQDNKKVRLLNHIVEHIDNQMLVGGHQLIELNENGVSAILIFINEEKYNQWINGFAMIQKIAKDM